MIKQIVDYKLVIKSNIKNLEDEVDRLIAKQLKTLEGSQTYWEPYGNLFITNGASYCQPMIRYIIIR